MFIFNFFRGFPFIPMGNFPRFFGEIFANFSRIFLIFKKHAIRDENTRFVNLLVGGPLAGLGSILRRKRAENE